MKAKNRKLVANILIWGGLIVLLIKNLNVVSILSIVAVIIGGFLMGKKRS